MRIRAKYESSCKVCRGVVRIDDYVEWAKGVPGVTHSACFAEVEPAAEPEPVAEPVEDTSVEALRAYLTALPALACGGCGIGCRGCDTRPSLAE